MSGFYELICASGVNPVADEFYYFYSPRAIRNPKSALRHGYAPDKMRLIIEDRESDPYEVRFMHNIFEYLYCKYFRRYFPFGYRVDWEKEEI